MKLWQITSKIKETEMDLHKKVEILQMIEEFENDLIKTAISALSLNELKAVQYVLSDKVSEKSFFKKEVAEKLNISASTIVGAFDKMQTAGILSVKTQGVKGVHLSVYNDKVFNLIEKV